MNQTLSQTPTPEDPNPTRDQLLQALYNLTAYATGNAGSMEGNPYSKDQVKAACALLAQAKGKKDWYGWNE
jgi:hypothetical protein